MIAQLPCRGSTLCRSAPVQGKLEDRAALKDAAQAMNEFPNDGSFMQRFQEQQQDREADSEVYMAGLAVP